MPQADGAHLIALFNAGRYADLAAQARALAARYPGNGFVWKVLGTGLLMLGRHEEGIEPLQQAVALMPGDVEAHSNLGNLLRACQRLPEAATSYRRAVEIKPDYAPAHFNLGITLADMGQWHAAVDAYRQAIRHQPGFAEAHNNLGNALKDLGRLDEALASYREAWRIKPDYAEACGNVLFARQYQAGSPPGLMLDEARQYGALVASRAQPCATWPNARQADRPLRVGLVSGDLVSHPVGYFLEGVMGALVRQTADPLTLHVYDNNPLSDAVTARLQTLVPNWRKVADWSDAQLAAQVREDGIDILVDLSGHTGLNRLPMFAWKPAPVQATWLGYVGTTGVSAIDWLIADPWTLPASEDRWFTERIWRLPETRLCFTPPSMDVPVTPLPARHNGHVRFACFNNLTKVNPAVLAVWARILRQLPDSELVLQAGQLDDEGERQRLLAQLDALGVAPTRVQLRGTSDRARYLAAYQDVDIALDPFPYTGGTTTAESLWMGVPVLTLAGERMIARQGVGLLMNAGLPDWVARDEADYVARAVAHARDLDALARLRSGLREQVLASPLFDAERFARHWCAALRGMWRQWLAS